MSRKKSPYKRLLLKLSGEALQGRQEYGIDPDVADSIAAQLFEIKETFPAVQIAIVIGGGNIFRGVQASAKGMDRASADYMGMLATIIISMALQDDLEQHGV